MVMGVMTQGKGFKGRGWSWGASVMRPSAKFGFQDEGSKACSHIKHCSLKISSTCFIALKQIFIDIR
jgi:hypothetical protein